MAWLSPSFCSTQLRCSLTSLSKLPCRKNYIVALSEPFRFTFHNATSFHPENYNHINSTFSVYQKFNHIRLQNVYHPPIPCHRSPVWLLRAAEGPGEASQGGWGHRPRREWVLTISEPQIASQDFCFFSPASHPLTIICLHLCLGYDWLWIAVVHDTGSTNHVSHATGDSKVPEALQKAVPKGVEKALPNRYDMEIATHPSNGIRRML